MLRIGNGYDVHPLVSGRRLILGGEEIPSQKGLLGHSDADVLVHSIMDALLGAVALGNIGDYFPDNVSKYKDVSSLLLLSEVKKMLLGKCNIINIDSTIVAQKPKLSGYIKKMIFNIANTLNLKENQVSIKATTTEKLGFVGREEGIAAYAVCLVDTNSN